MQQEKMLPFKKGQKFWIELQAFEDGSIEDCKNIGKMVFKEMKLDSFDITQFILKESHFSRTALEELREVIDQKLAT